MRIAVVFCFFLFSLLANGQEESAEILQLKTQSAQATELKEKAKLYNDLAWEYYPLNYDSALKYVNLAITASDALGDPYWRAVSLEMLAILKEISGQYEEAIMLYFEVIPIWESIGGKGLENTYNNMAIIFRNQENYEKGYQYFRKSYLIELENNHAEGIAGSLINMAITEKYLNRRDSLKIHLWQANDIAKKVKNDDLTLNSMINLGVAYLEENGLDSARYYYEKALDIATAQNSSGDLAVINTGLAEINFSNGNTSAALSYFERAEFFSNAIHSVVYLKRIFAAKATIYASMGDYQKAYENNKKYHLLHDSLINVELVEKTNDLEKRYETEKKERQITELQLASAEQALRSERDKDTRRLLILLAVILVMALWFGFYRYRKQERTSALLQDKNETIAAALKDREILLREIHHRVKNNLQVVSSLLSIQGREISDEKALEAVNESKHRVQSMALIHQYLYGENDLKSIDMRKYITQLSHNLFNAYKLDHDKVELKIEVEPIMLDVDTAVPLGIIINELITNALKYAFPANAAGTLTVKLAESEGRLNLFVSDTGNGITDKAGTSYAFGMKLINAFKNKLKAELKTSSENGYQVLFSIGKYSRA